MDYSTVDYYKVLDSDDEVHPSLAHLTKDKGIHTEMEYAIYVPEKVALAANIGTLDTSAWVAYATASIVMCTRIPTNIIDSLERSMVQRFFLHP